MRVVVTGGGTGGHLYPALAVSEALQIQGDVQLLYIGNQARREAQLLPQHDIPFAGITFSGMPRGITWCIVPWLIAFFRSLLRSWQLLRQFKPHVVFATGGYVTAPVLLAAKIRGIPFVLHEPDAHPGLVNRVMAPWASHITCAFEAAKAQLNQTQITTTGNPLRQQIGSVPPQEGLQRLGLSFTLEKPILFVTGGSQGARRINTTVLQALPVLIDELGWQVLHQTGETDYLRVLETCSPLYRHHTAYVPFTFIEDMGAALSLATVAIGRSGSMTLSEMYRAGIPTLLVPYPFAAADHQRKNAEASQAQGASYMILDEAFTGEALVQAMQTIFAVPQTLTAMQRACTRLAYPQATQAVLQVLRSVTAVKS